MESKHEEMPGMDFEAMMQDEAFRMAAEEYAAREVEAARAGWVQDEQRRIRRAREEGERAARMDADEHVAQRFADREAELNVREAQIHQRELRAGILQQLHMRGLPEELQAAISFDSEEGAQQSLDAVEQAFRSAVQQGIEQRMRGETPGMARMPSRADVSDKDYYGAHFAP